MITRKVYVKMDSKNPIPYEEFHNFFYEIPNNTDVEVTVEGGFVTMRAEMDES